MRSRARSTEAIAYRRLYRSHHWREVRAAHLANHPLCVFCLAQGRITPATVVDHIAPHRGDVGLFFDPGNLQSLCDAQPYRCHSSAKQSEERRGYDKGVGLDGFPVDPRHPANR